MQRQRALDTGLYIFIGRYYTATMNEYLHDAKDYGFDVTVNSFSWRQIKEKRDAYITRLNGIYDNNLKKV